MMEIYIAQAHLQDGSVCPDDMCSVGNMTEQFQSTCNSPLPFHEVLLGLSITVVGISGLKDGPGIKS